jgi:hypothetical protein
VPGITALGPYSLRSTHKKRWFGSSLVFALFGPAVSSSLRERRRTVADRARQRTPVTPATLVRRLDATPRRTSSSDRAWGSSGREGTTTARFQLEDKMATTNTVNANVTVKFVVNEKGNPPGKLADAELHFNDGVLAGLKLIGFAVWERRTGGGRNVTFPARQYSVNGERRSFALLRPIEDVAAQARIRDLIIEAYAELEAGAA